MYTYDHGSSKWTPLIKCTVDVEAPWVIKSWGFHLPRRNYQTWIQSPCLARPPPGLRAKWVSCSCSMEDGEKEETAGEEQAKALWAEATKKKKRRRGQKVEKPEAFMANFFKGLEIYQTKLLVSAPAQAPPLVQELARGKPQRNGFCFKIWLVMLPHFLIPLRFLFSFICLLLLCWRKSKRG